MYEYVGNRHWEEIRDKSTLYVETSLKSSLWIIWLQMSDVTDVLVTDGSDDEEHGPSLHVINNAEVSNFSCNLTRACQNWIWLAQYGYFRVKQPLNFELYKHYKSTNSSENLLKKYLRKYLGSANGKGCLSQWVKNYITAYSCFRGVNDNFYIMVRNCLGS